MVSNPRKQGRVRSIKEAKQQVHEAKKEYREQLRESAHDPDKTPGNLDKTPGNLGELGCGRGNALPVDAPVRDERSAPSNLPQFARRLNRLACGVDRTDRGTTAVFDFALFEIREETIARLRGEGSYRSCAILSTAGDGPVIKEFAIRLKPPQQFIGSAAGRDDAVRAVRNLVERVGPPCSDTRVWLRPVFTTMGPAPRSSHGYGASELLNGVHPHVGGRGVSVNSTVFLDFLSDLLSVYPKGLVD